MAEDAPATAVDPQAEAPVAEGETPAADIPTEVLFPQSKEEKKMEQKMIKVIERMHANVQNRFKSLYVFSDERSKLNDLFEKEVRELSEKFEKRKVPILNKRDNILNGEITEFDDACIEFDEKFTKLETAVAGIVKTEEEKERDAEEESKHTPVPVEHLKDKAGVPDFWQNAIKNHEMLQTIITDADKPIMKHLKTLHAAQCKIPQPQLTITMTFEQNEYFTNETISFIAVADNDTNQTIEIKGTEIDW